MTYRCQHLRRLGGLALAILAGLAAGTQAGVVGAPFAISDGRSKILPENQPQVAFGNGKYLVVYTHWGYDSQHQTSGNIYGAFVNPLNSRIDTFPIDTYDSSSTSPVVAYDPDNDRYLLAYEDKRSEYPDSDLYIRLLDGTGQTLTECFIATTDEFERMPDVAYIGGGKFVVVWCSTTNPNLPTDSVVIARTVSYSEPDFILGAEQLVYDGTLFVGLTHPKVAVNKFSQCLVVWQWPSSTAGTTTDQWVHAIQGRVLDGDGVPLGSVATLSSGADNQTLPSVAYDSSDDQFCIAWQDLTPDGDHDVLGTLASITAGSVAATTPLQIAAVTRDDTKPSVCWNDGKHEFQVLWEAEYSLQDHEIYARPISPAGVGGTQIHVVDSADMETSPVLARGYEQFLTVWEDDVPGSDAARVHGAFLYDVAPPPHVRNVWPPLVTVQYKIDSPSQILIEFDQAVVISQADVTVQGLQTGAHNNFTLTYNTAGRSATLSWSSPLGDDTYLVTVKDTVLDDSGFKLDGEMNLLLPGLPSGNGVAGGNFQGLIYRLVGDANGDRSVDTADLLSMASTWALYSTDPGFDPLLDLNNDNTINVVDLLILAEHWGRTIPAGP